MAEAAPVTPAAPAKGATTLTPATSDVAPMYLAIVSPDDPAAVMSLVALVPSSAQSTSPIAYKRSKAQWVKDDQTLRDLKSATPPPVVSIDMSILNDVLTQVDKASPAATTASGLIPLFSLDDLDKPADTIYELDSMVAAVWANTLLAAGGLDRNKGNAERLRRYWVHGEGAAKIRWGEGGDWKRCVRHLSKYLGVRAKGYCELRHQEATGMATATHAKLDRAKHNAVDEFSDVNITIVTPEDMDTPIEEIQAEHDPKYDATWTPEPEVEDLLQDEACKKAMTAAGGLDRNRGNAEALRRYWTHGKGAAKIRWGTKGDWARCVRHLSKFMGVRAKGYCQLRHKDALGFYTSTHAKMDRQHHFASEETFNEKFIEQAFLTAKANEARARMSLTAGAITAPVDGARFTIPLVIPEELESGDGRSFQKNSVDIRELPLPLLWQYKTGEGHSGSVVVGRIEHMERIDNGIGNAYGVFDTGAHGAEAERLVRNGFLRGVSADLDQFEAKESKAKETTDELGDELGKDKLNISHARVMAVTIVPKPAFQECTISLMKDVEKEKPVTPEDGVYEESVDNKVVPTAMTASGFLSTPIPTVPPTDWFTNPGLEKATPLTIGEDGRVFGHIAAWHVNHIGLPNNTKPPRSRSNYGYFHTGLVRTDSGKDIPVGQLTLAGGHASLHASAQAAAKHYDDTASAIADVHAGEDKFGIWVAGSLRPEATESQIRSLRASAPSGDWRPVGGSLELVAVCQVNVPGFPIARALMASGSVVALVAAGAYEMAMLRNDAASKLSAKADALGALSASVDSMSIRERIEMKRLDAEFGYIPRAEREEMAKKGFALPDGSFPIKTADDVKAAIHAYGRAKPSHRAAVRKHIIKRANSLKASHLIPDAWKETSALTASADDFRVKAEMTAAYAELASIPLETRMELAKKGQALPDGSYPIRNIADLKNAIKSYGRSKTSDRAKVRKHIEKRARALKASELVPAEWKNAASNEVFSTVESMRMKIEAITAAADAPQATDSQIQSLIDAKNAADAEQEQIRAEIKAREEGKAPAGNPAPAGAPAPAQAEAPATQNPNAPIDPNTPALPNGVEAPKTAVTDNPNNPDTGAKYIPGKTQPRDATGQFRKVLARLKQDLGVSGLQDALKQVQDTENLEFAGNYTQAAKSASDLLGTIDRLDSGALDATKIDSVRTTAAALGKVISNLPLPFNNQAQKVRFSDLPPALKDLMKTMVDRVDKKIGEKDAGPATAKVKSFMSGADVYSQSEISSHMATLLRLLT